MNRLTLASMRAFRLTQWRTPAEWHDVPLPEPQPGYALVKIGGAGVCHSDLHLMHEWSPETMPGLAHWALPFTLGHENAGWVAGGEAGGLDVGTPVIVSPTWSCGQCAACRAGATNYCEHPVHSNQSGGLGLDGGIAEYMLAPTAALVPLGDVEPWRAAPLADAGLSAYHAVKRCLPLLDAGATVVVIGVGGLGRMAVEFLRELTPARIACVDRDESALGRARERGAALCLEAGAETAREIKRATQGLGASAVIDFVGSSATAKLAAAAARKRGQVVVVGLGGGAVRVGYGTLPPGCSAVMTLGGSTGELAEVVALVQAGRVETHAQRFAMKDAETAFAQLAAGQLTGRAVLVPEE